MKEQVSQLGKSAVVQYVTVFRLILAKRVKHWSRAWGIILRALMWAVTSLWPQKVAFRSQNYSARAKLMLISDQARDCKNLFWRPASMCPFQNGSSTSGILNKLTVWAKFACDDLCGESKSYWERVMWWYFTHIKCGDIMSGLVVESFISAANMVNCGISWSCWQTDFR